MTVLLTGGTGYIGSHAAAAIIAAGQRVVLFDDLSNSEASVIDRLERLSGTRPGFVRGDVRDAGLLADTLARHGVQAVMHFAGFKAVGESTREPLRYYANNVEGAISVAQAMADAGVRRLIFSSSATVYGPPAYLPIDEAHPTRACNPYGRSKLQIEEILQDLARSDATWRIASLRYFNPVGAHASGLIGESPRGVPSNLMPYVAQVASGRLPRLEVFGTDYNTPDGSGVRDFLHVEDLAEGHAAALGFLEREAGFHVFNLGTGRGHSVLELLAAFEAATGRRVPRTVVSRRPGDVAACYANVDRARTQLGWGARRGLDEMCRSAWRWELQSTGAVPLSAGTDQ